MKNLSVVKYRQDETLRMKTANSRADNILKATKQGIVTDSFINNREGENFAFTDTSLPEDLKKIVTVNDKNTGKQLLTMISVPLGVLGVGTLVTGILASTHKKKLTPELAQKTGVAKVFRSVKKLFTDSEKGPIVPPNINIKTENQYATYEALRDPSLKKLLGVMAVFTFSSAAFVLKNTTDGLKEIWVKKKDADIQRNYQEKMIDIETRSFAGKKQVARHLLDKNANMLNIFNKSRNIFFAGNKKPKKSSEKQSIGLSNVLIGVGAIAASVFFIKNTLKNIRKINKTIEIAISKESHAGKKSSSWGTTHEMYGNKDGKPTVFAYLDDVQGHLYNMVMNPSKFTGRLAASIAAVAGTSYTGAKFVEANKEVQVKKVNTETDLDMHDKLVRVELKNFMIKKEIAVKPLTDEYKEFASRGSANVKTLKTRFNGIMDEIKNGPPFIYD